MDSENVNRQSVAGFELLGEVTFPTGFLFAETEVGGLSGLAYDAVGDIFYALSDDRSQINPARFYTLDIDLSDGALDDGGVTFTGVTTLTDFSGQPFAPDTVDPEGIALTPNGTFLIASEGDANALIPPFVNEFSLAGGALGELPVPDRYLPTTDQTTGIRNNLAFESLTITPDGQFGYTAVENALFQDGPASTLDNGSLSRILQYDLDTQDVVGEFVYEVDPIPVAPVPADSFSDNGLVELLALDNNGTLLALERSFAVGIGNTIRLYEVQTQGALDVSNTDDLFREDPLEDDGEILPPGPFEIDPTVGKRLLLDVEADLGVDPDNLEALSFGPTLPDGSPSLIFASDNNFNPNGQVTQFIALGLDLTETPVVLPVVETPLTIDEPDAPTPIQGDSDDPAIWVNPHSAAESVVIATLKDGGLATFDLEGNVLQTILDAEFGEIRYNNVDLVYGFELGGEPVDLAVVSDRENDTLALFEIDPETRQLTDITAPNTLETIFGVDDGSATAYGLATYTSPVSGDSFAFVTQRDGDQVAQVQLLDNGDGTVAAEVVRTLQLPVPTGDPEDSQSEGIVVDQELGFLYVALEEEVGILRFSAEVDGGDEFTVVRPIESPELVPDIEGLTLYYGPEGTGYLIANSQGDSSYAVYRREGFNEFLGSFAIGENGPIDQANESDGLDVINLPLGDAFPNGLLVVQDGANDPQNVVEDDEELENNSTNFKFVPFDDVANAFPEPLPIAPDSYDPRNPEAHSLINGIASGDTTQTSTVLWARSTFPGEVTFEYSTSADFSTLDGTAMATVTDIFQPVTVEVEGLDPGTEYFYRVTDAAGDSEVGVFQTSAPLGEFAGLRFGATGDWRGELAPYPGISNADVADLEFFVALGDTIYADFDTPALPQEQAETLAEFRIRHDEVYSERFGLNTLADLRASTSILATIDDHEVINDFAGGATISSDDEGTDGANRFLNAFPDDDPNILQNDSTLFENGLQAFQEYNPIREEFYGDTGDERTAFERELYRHNTYGSDAATFVLDNRSFRDEALDNPDVTSLSIDLATGTDPVTAFTNFVVNEVIPFEVAAFDASRTLLGEAQLTDLLTDLQAAQDDGITWKFVVVPEPFQGLGPLLGPSDRFDGYLAERTQIVEFIEDNNIDNVVFIAADIHGTIVNNVTYQETPGGPQRPTSIFEVTTGSLAFDAPFGQTVAGGAAAAGFLSPEEFAFYETLPAIADPATFSQDDFLTTLLNDTALTPFGLDPLGLDNNLPGTEGLIDAELLQGRYVAAHTYGWTQFDVDPFTQELTVTTYGIEFYSEEEIRSGDPAIVDEILAREPVIVSQFVVTPQNFEPIAPSPVLGTSGDDLIFAGDSTSFTGIEDVVFTGAGLDEVDIVLGSDEETGGNRVNTGSDDDVISVSSRDRVSGSTGNDLFDAELSLGNNRMSGGAGDDDFVLGGNRDRALGGDGADTFEILAFASQNIIAGGADADTFFLLPNGAVPESAPNHQILDFEVGTDIISFGIGITTADVVVGADGNNATLSIFDLELATFSGVSQANLQSTVDSAFA